MNEGIGIDIVDIKKFKKITYSSKPHFYEKLFLKSEIDYCLRFKNSAERFAGKFAVKEAVIKSLNYKIKLLGITEMINKNIETIDIILFL